MYGILKKFFEFSGRENKRKFQISIVLGVLQAIGEAMKIPAIMIILIAVTDKNISTGMIWGAVAVMTASVLISFVSKMRSTMLQTEGGYNAAAFKRVEIARHLRYLPMGYFNKNSLGEITSVTTNTMENLGNKDGKPAPRLERAIRRLRVNLGGELPFESMLCGECTKANENASEGYPKMLYAWDAGEFADTFDALLSCTNYQVERMNPTQALNQYPTYRTLYSEDGVWSAAECPANNGAVLLYYTIFSPVSRKDEGSNLDVPDPSAQTYLDLVGDGTMQ